jgi:hypothetical protein
MTKTTIRVLVFIALAALSMYLSYWRGWANGYGAGHTHGYQLAVEDAKSPAPPPVQHHYRFERDGASLWRYDEATGKSCQIESSVRDNWVGVVCPVEEK